MNRTIIKNVLLGVGLLALCALLIGTILARTNNSTTEEALAADYRDATYRVEGEAIALVDGFSESEAAPGSAEKVATRFFGNELLHDLDDDGREDVVFLLTQSRGGSGTFYYVVAALNTQDGYRGSEAFLLGDRIAPQSTNVDEGVGAEGRTRRNVVVVNYADRTSGEPMAAKPTIGKSVWLKLNPETMQWGEVAQNFEGESR